MTTYEDFIVRRLWELHKSPRAGHLEGILASPRDLSVYNSRLDDPHLQKDFRFRGYPGQSFFSPRQPARRSTEDERLRNEERMLRVFGTTSLYDPARPASRDRPRSPKVARNDLEPTFDFTPRERTVRDPLGEKTDDERRKLLKQQEDADLDIARHREEKQRREAERVEERRRDLNMLKNDYYWDSRKDGHGAPRGDGHNRRLKFTESDLTPREVPSYKDPMARKSDLFLEDLKRKNDRQKLEEMHGQDQSNLTSIERQAEERKLAMQEDRIREMRRELEMMKQKAGSHTPQPPSPQRERLASRSRSENLNNRGRDHRASLDLESTRGGAGAPIRDANGRAITRMPITMSRNDYGVSKMTDEMPGRRRPAYLDESEDGYFPFGRQGGGAPLRDANNEIVTNVYGKLGRETGSADQRRKARAAQVYHNELSYLRAEQKRNKEDTENYVKAPIGEFARVMNAMPTGKPRRDPITGLLQDHHLGQTDISRQNQIQSDYVAKKRYHDELTQLAVDRKQREQLDKMKDRQQGNLHQQSFDTYWGTFGGGAPKGTVLKKVNLENALFSPRSRGGPDPRGGPNFHEHFDVRPHPSDSMRVANGLPDVYSPTRVNQYRKAVDAELGTEDTSLPRYVKNTIRSTHSNLYDMAPNRNWRTRDVPPPYATGGYD